MGDLPTGQATRDCRRNPAALETACITRAGSGGRPNKFHGSQNRMMLPPGGRLRRFLKWCMLAKKGAGHGYIAEVCQ